MRWAKRRVSDAYASEIAFDLVLLILIVVLWITTRPYQGVADDARYYIVQAIRDLHPARFANDLHFEFGSEDAYSIFSRCIAPLVVWLGVGTAELVLTLAGQVLWLGGLVYLALGLLGERRVALLSVAVLIALPAVYGVWSSGYGEPYATPRLFVEAFTMLALGLLLRGRTVWALLILVASIAVHPIMALAGLGFAVLYLAFAEPVWWLVIGCGAAAAVGLSFAEFKPFADLQVILDPAWLEIARVRDGFSFMTRWWPGAYFQVCDTIALAALALAVAKGRERRFIATALVVGIGGLLFTLFGADLAHDLFFAEIQPYRMMWLVTLVANLYVVSVVVRMINDRDSGVLLTTGFVVATISFLVSPFVAAPMLVLTALFYYRRAIRNRRFGYVAEVLYAFAIAATIILTIVLAYLGSSFLEHVWWSKFERRIYDICVVGGVMILLVACVVQMERGRGLPRFMPWLAIFLVPISLAGWDARTPWTKFVESSKPVPASLAALIPQHASVYWEGGIEMLWLRMQRSGYFSCTQGTGSVFFRKVALVYKHRQQSFKKFDTADFGESLYCPDYKRGVASTKTRQSLTGICQREPNLDYLILAKPIENVEAEIWQSPVAEEIVQWVNNKPVISHTSRFYIYSCADWR